MIGDPLALVEQTLEHLESKIQEELEMKKNLQEALEVTEERLGRLSYLFYTVSKQKEMLIHDKEKKEGKR